MSEALNIVAIAIAVTGHEGALRAVQQRLVADTLKESGCLRFELTQSLEDTRVLVFIETWATEKDWRAHMQGGAIRRFQASGGPQLIQDFTLLRLRPVVPTESLELLQANKS